MKRALGIALVMALSLCGCDRGATSVSTQNRQPNILFVIWDTVRVDHLSLYGHSRKTTPKLDAWAAQARVFEDCVSPGSTTVPAHASIFTGLFPTQHRADNEHPQLDEQFTTLAEILRDSGYATYMFSANPHLSATSKFTQGFDVAEHPWDPQYREEAIAIIRSKVTDEDESGELAGKLRNPNTVAKLTDWNVKTAGALAEKGALKWLESKPADKPYFVFINYMEAHRPLIPSRDHRARFMSPEQIAASYKVNRSWVSTWAYTFGLKEFSDEEIELTRLTYDACLAELDDLFADLLDGLRAAGQLDNTIVVLAADHGEHLGEHHMLDHQFSVYEELLRVPLIVWYPPKFAPGREKRPVMTMDLFPTLLKLAGVPDEHVPANEAVSLLSPMEHRDRLSEYPAPNTDALTEVARAYKRFDPRPWQRSLRAYYRDRFKLIDASDDHDELYNLQSDPHEQNNLATSRKELADAINDSLKALLKSLSRVGQRETLAPRTPEETKRLMDLGYVGSHGGEPEEEEEPETATQPASSPGEKP